MYRSVWIDIALAGDQHLQLLIVARLNILLLCLEVPTALPKNIQFFLRMTPYRLVNSRVVSNTYSVEK